MSLSYGVYYLYFKMDWLEETKDKFPLRWTIKSITSVQPWLCLADVQYKNIISQFKWSTKTFINLISTWAWNSPVLYFCWANTITKFEQIYLCYPHAWYHQKVGIKTCKSSPKLVLSLGLGLISVWETWPYCLPCSASYVSMPPIGIKTQYS